MKNSKEFKEEFKICCNKYKYIINPTHTDYNGFMNLLNKIKKSNSKLLFLTARNKENYHILVFHLMKMTYITPTLLLQKENISKNEIKLFLLMIKSLILKLLLIYFHKLFVTIFI